MALKFEGYCAVCKHHLGSRTRGPCSECTIKNPSHFESVREKVRYDPGPFNEWLHGEDRSINQDHPAPPPDPLPQVYIKDFRTPERGVWKPVDLDDKEIKELEKRCSKDPVPWSSSDADPVEDIREEYKRAFERSMSTNTDNPYIERIIGTMKERGNLREFPPPLTSIGNEDKWGTPTHDNIMEMIDYLVLKLKEYGKPNRAIFGTEAYKQLLWAVSYRQGHPKEHVEILVSCGCEMTVEVDESKPPSSIHIYLPTEEKAEGPWKDSI